MNLYHCLASSIAFSTAGEYMSLMATPGRSPDLTSGGSTVKLPKKMFCSSILSCSSNDVLASALDSILASLLLSSLIMAYGFPVIEPLMAKSPPLRNSMGNAYALLFSHSCDTAISYISMFDCEFVQQAPFSALL